MDERVIDIKPVWRWLLLHCAILPFRPQRSAEAYMKIWWPEGSPLIVISQRVLAQLRPQVKLPMALAMRYGQPSIDVALNELVVNHKVTEIRLIPLFPHYAMSSYETAVKKVETWVLAHNLKNEPARSYQKRTEPIVKLSVLPPFYKDPAYLQALVASAQDTLKRSYDHLLFSFHGIPERHLSKTDQHQHCLKSENCCTTPSAAHQTCYRHQCYETSKAFGARTGIAADKYSVAFQSRLGRETWLRPYTDHAIADLARQGVRRLAVICPAFVSDCLETLEEIGIRGRDAFLAAGGEELRLVPCMNEHPLWVAALKKWSVS